MKGWGDYIYGWRVWDCDWRWGLEWDLDTALLKALDGLSWESVMHYGT
jgi:hypothetical protein